MGWTISDILYNVGLPLSVVYILYALLSPRRRKMSLQDKVVLITGASSGLGRACAHAFYAAGCKVILSARNVDALDKVKQDIMNSTEAGKAIQKYTPKVLKLDLSDIAHIPKFARQALNFYDRVDILVNNAGISYRGEAQSTTTDVDLQLLTVNYLGQVALTKALLPSMRQQGEGSIVAVSSVQGRIAIPYRSAYAASKHATQAFFDSLRAEVASKNINVLVVSPGYIKTNLSLNAVTADGTSYGAMDATTANGMEPEYVAKRIIDGTSRGLEEITLCPMMHKLAIILRAILPTVYFSIMRKRAEKGQ
ncbi:unnamed protein product [Owenia fusiformis]|uniref:Uncharacterized protein n=1 Tax=Owenia fusiformis TaxID=6347 RepID=A0A8J1UQ77_OWEFU|nr:unnamed protein product [Owenia fusiformis]